MSLRVKCLLTEWEINYPVHMIYFFSFSLFVDDLFQRGRKSDHPKVFGGFWFPALKNICCLWGDFHRNALDYIKRGKYHLLHNLNDKKIFWCMCFLHFPLWRAGYSQDPFSFVFVNLTFFVKCSSAHSQSNQTKSDDDFNELIRRGGKSPIFTMKVQTSWLMGLCLRSSTANTSVTF